MRKVKFVNLPDPRLTLQQIIEIASKQAEENLRLARQRQAKDIERGEASTELKRQKYAPAAYSVVVAGKEISYTCFPRFGVKRQTGKRLEEYALLDLKIYSKKYGEEMQIKFFRYTPKNPRLLAKIYKPLTPLPLSR